MDEMVKGNVLVLGNSGVGKSTLINAVLGERLTKTGYGTVGTTKHLEVFENNEINFRLIDSVGFEPDLFKRYQAIKAVQTWCKNTAKAGNENSKINVIWFCVDGTSRKLFRQSIESLSRAASVYKTVPVIVVITKSYSRPDRDSNIQMVQQAFSGKIGKKLNLKGIIPVVAELYRLDETAFAPVDGINELIQLTNDVMPEGIAAADNDIERYKLERTNNFAHTIIGASTVSGVLIGAVPLPSPLTDGAILSGIELAEVNGLAKVYGIKKNNKSAAMFEKIVEIGTVSAVARATCGAVLKVIPVAGWVANAAVAGSFVAAIGEGTRYIFEQIKLGNRSVQDIEWAEKLLIDKLTGQFTQKAKQAFATLSETSTKDDIIKAVAQMFTTDQSDDAPIRDRAK